MSPKEKIQPRGNHQGRTLIKTDESSAAICRAEQGRAIVRREAVGVTGENGKKVLLSLIFIALVWFLAWVIGKITSALLGKRSQRAAFWTKQGVHLFSAATIVIVLCSVWFTDLGRLATAFGLVTADLAFALQRDYSLCRLPCGSDPGSTPDESSLARTEEILLTATRAAEHGRLVAVCTRATNRADGASSVISHAAPTFCIQVPIFDITDAIHSQ